MTEQVLLITGTSSGIGLHTAVAAAQAGYRVVATVRAPERANALRVAAEDAGVDLDVHALDVTDPESVDACIEYVVTTYGRLDVLVNNAGSGRLGTIELEPLGAIREVMEINFFGVVAMTKAALPLLRASGGRLVTVSSVGGVVGQPFNEAYCAAKFAVEGFMESLAPVAAAVGVHVSVVEPGAVATNFVATVYAQDAPVVTGTPYADPFTAYTERTRTAFDPSNAQTPEDVATVIVDVLRAVEPAARVQTSLAARQFAGVKLADLDGAQVQAMTKSWVAPR